MATKARQQYFADEISLQKQRREFSLEDNIKQKIDSVEEGAQVNRIETVKVNGTALTPDANKAVNVLVPDVIDNLYSTSTDDALSAKQGKVLYDYLQNIASRGRFLSNWNCATGLPVTNPTENPYPYKAGDYYSISNVATGGGTNYRPDGSSYTIGQASTTAETEEVNVSDFYLYDGTNWLLLVNTARQIAVDSSLSTTSTNPVENRVVTNAINGKQDTLTAGTGININGTTISATGLTILEYGVSTWSDFTTAYNANRIVYCMVPVTGGNRMAFLAYVNTTVGNENAEFQYYRSISSHSDSAQGDEVYIYKLLSDGSWSTTTRKTYSKVAAGTNMTSSYSSGTITLNADSQLPAGGTNGQVLTQTNNGPAWQNPTGGDVLVSTQANNIFTPGMKIWGGTESDYQSLTPDSNTAYLLLAGGPTPGGWGTITGFSYVDVLSSYTGGDVNGMVWKPDGTKFYITGEQNNRVYQYSVSTPRDVTTATYDNKYVATTLNVSNSIIFSDDGLTMWIGGGWATGYVYKWTLSTAWDVSTASYVGDTTGKSNISFSECTGYWMANNGQYLFVLSRGNKWIRRYTMLTPYDITTLDATYQEYSGLPNTCHKLLLNPDGTQLFYYARDDKKIHICALSTAFDLTSLSETSQYTVPTPNSNDITSVTIDNSGNSMWIGGYNIGGIYQYSTTTA